MQYSIEINSNFCRDCNKNVKCERAPMNMGCGDLVMIFLTGSMGVALAQTNVALGFLVGFSWLAVRTVFKPPWRCSVCGRRGVMTCEEFQKEWTGEIKSRTKALFAAGVKHLNSCTNCQTYMEPLLAKSIENWQAQATINFEAHYRQMRESIMSDPEAASVIEGEQNDVRGDLPAVRRPLLD